jgi:exopolysaccharide production protein ExoQ
MNSGLKANQCVATSEPELYSLPRETTDRNAFAAFAFTCLLLVIFVGLKPFAPPAEVASFGGVEEAGAGNALRQIAYISVFLLIVTSAFLRTGWEAFRSVPSSVVVLLIWCAASALWAGEPAVVLRRAGLEIVIVLSVFMGVGSIGADRAFRILRILLAVILVVNWLSIPLLSAAVHPPNEGDVALIGNWRGLYGHKNIAGAVCVLTAMLFLFTKTGKGNWIGILVAIGATGFLLMSHSKSSLGFLPLGLMAGWLYKIGWRDGLSRAISSVCVLLLLLVSFVFLSLKAEVLTRLIEDPAEFTGRAAIWQAEISYIQDHLLLGAGFGSFTDSGGLSPLHNYVGNKWVETVSHGHNGYLQLLVTIGGVGFLLAMIALVIVPGLRFWKLDRGQTAFKPLLFAIFIFSLAHNVMESDFLEADGVSWAALLIMIAGLKEIEKVHYREQSFPNRAPRYSAPSPTFSPASAE